jgi:hypothetical protein
MFGKTEASAVAARSPWPRALPFRSIRSEQMSISSEAREALVEYLMKARQIDRVEANHQVSYGVPNGWFSNAEPELRALVVAVQEHYGPRWTEREPGGLSVLFTTIRWTFREPYSLLDS